MIYEVATQRGLAEIDTRLHEAVARHKFGILTIHNLQETMQKKGVEFANVCIIYEVCNPLQAKKVLEANGAMSTVLPCRISVYGKDGALRLATIRPTSLMRMMGDSSLDLVAKEVEETLFAIMDEAA